MNEKAGKPILIFASLICVFCAIAMAFAIYDLAFGATNSTRLAGLAAVMVLAVALTLFGLLIRAARRRHGRTGQSR